MHEHKSTVTVQFWDKYKEVPYENIKFVGGDEGIFATYQVGNLVHFLAGDDGAWWCIASYHQDWLGGISKNIYSYCTNGRRK